MEKRKNEGFREKSYKRDKPLWDKNTETITVFVRQDQSEWKELDSEKILPYFTHFFKQIEK